MNIIKASGQREPFNEEKIKNSLRRVNLGEADIEYIVSKVKKRLKPGITSDQILKMVLSMLRNKGIHYSSRYNLKRAMIDLGPSGYPFEIFFSKLLKEYGYSVEVGQVVKGHCANQEIDIIAIKAHKHYMVECKFHNTFGAKSDLKVALYTYARFLDVKEAWKKKETNIDKIHQAMLVTNTKCSADAIQFAECRGIKIICWKYPQKENLENLIESKSLYPITVLPSLNKQAKDILFKENIFFVKELIDCKADLPIDKIDQLKNEASLII
ncbi:MAG: ATP cone domain protein [Parcubacteria group bacterium ADurb.Bin247]|jgi:Holliday junction resolvase|nr:MAG: ATP cone domain protein [Parcubacteria group bacterium ADurb.Bin247]